MYCGNYGCCGKKFLLIEAVEAVTAVGAKVPDYSTR